MKKFYLILLLFAAFHVSAQEFHFIPKVGLNLANMSNSGGSMKPGLNIGVAGEIMLTKAFAIEPGIYYSMQGSKSEDSSEGTLMFKNDYLNIPVYAKGYLYKGLYAFAGPQFGFNVSSKAAASVSGVSASVDMKGIKTFDLAVGIGVGYQFDLGLLLSANYNIGLTNTLGDKFEAQGMTFETGGEKSRNSVFQLNVGWRF